MYKQVDTNLNFVEREKAVEKFWKDNDIFRKSIDIGQCLWYTIDTETNKG